LPERRYRSESQLGDYVGNDPLTPNFALRIFSKGAELLVQGTNQRALELASVKKMFLSRSPLPLKSTSRATPAARWSP
jgi:hypothetical protein